MACGLIRALKCLPEATSSRESGRGVGRRAERLVSAEFWTPDPVCSCILVILFLFQWMETTLKSHGFLCLDGSREITLLLNLNGNSIKLVSLTSSLEVPKHSLCNV